jgi:hypothetical protein
VFLDYMIELGGEPNLTSGGEPSKQKVLWNTKKNWGDQFKIKGGVC